jgi:osmotically-inducible protein OsmY
MKHTLALALILGLAACGEDANLAPAAQAAAPQPVAAPIVKSDPDTELAERVMRAIDQASLHGIEAVAAEGVVTLWGTTVDANERSRAGDIAARVEGVKSVENRLEVVSGS